MSLPDAAAGVHQQMPPSAAGGPGCIDRGLSCRHRLKDAYAFRETFRAGRRRAGRFLVMWLRCADDASLKLAVIVSKNTLRLSVDRARAKRLMREAFRLNRHRLTGKVDFILVARRDIIKARRQEVDAEILRLAGEAGILAK